MAAEIAKYKMVEDTDCDICRGFYHFIYEFTYTLTKKGSNVVSIEKCRFCPECLENVKKEFGDDYGSI